METSKKENIAISWWLWHFYQMPKFLLSMWKNYLSFGLNFFSVPFLLSTLFAPWRKYKWGYPRGFSISGYLETFISNILSRIIGALCRLVLVIFGVIAQIFIVIAGIIIILLWMFMPFILLVLILFLFYGI